MKGHIRQRSKGSWTIVVDVGRDPETGKRQQQWHTVKGTKRNAQKMLNEILVAMDKGTYVKPNRLTLGEWLGQWLDSYVVMHTTPRTQESYHSIIHIHLLPSLGSIPLHQLRPQHIQSYYARALVSGRANQKGGLSARSVLYHHRILSEALSHAVRMGVVVRNAADLVDPPRPPRAKIATLIPEEVRKFLDAAQETSYYVFFSTLLYTGLRRGELLALRWRNLDLAMGSLSVVETAFKLRDGEYVISQPKTPHSRRTVSLSLSLVTLIRVYRADHELLRIQLGDTLKDDDFVFMQPDGSPLSPNAVTLAFRRIIRKAGLNHIRVHDLRHTHATLMLKAGVHPKIVSERLGHAGVGITLDIYSHVLPGLQEAAAEKFDRILDLDESTIIRESNVSKTLAEGDETGSRPYRSRTCDTLIKSQVLIHPLFLRSLGVDSPLVQPLFHRIRCSTFSSIFEHH